MKMHVRGLVAATLVLAAIGLFAVSGRGIADDKGDVKQSVQKVADAIDKGDSVQAQKLAEDIAKSFELEEVMNLMGLRKATSKKAVFGVGDKPAAIIPDGIEAKINILTKKPLSQEQLSRESMALVQLGNRVAAIAEIAKVKVPEKDEGAKKKKDWIEWTGDLQKATKEFTEAAKEKKPADIKSAAAKMYSACNNCHGVFRD